jgi:hypothetical protein
MHHLTDNHYPIAWFIGQCLEHAFRQKDEERAELTKFTLKLPVFLYNAGYTPSIIPPGSIHIKPDSHRVHINIDNVGQFIYDISARRLVPPPNVVTLSDSAFPDEKPEQVVAAIKDDWLKRKHLVKKASALYETNKAFTTMENDI